MGLDDLIVLVFAEDKKHTTMVAPSDVDSRDFSVSLERGTWSYERNLDVPIGHARTKPRGIINRESGRVIGVYKRNNATHTNALVADSISFTRY